MIRAILRAIEESDFSTLEKVDPARVLEKGRTPLHFAVIRRKHEVVRYLLKKGANPNLRDDYGNTPLHYAYENGDVEMVSILMRAGVDRGVVLEVLRKFGRL